MRPSYEGKTQNSVVLDGRYVQEYFPGIGRYVYNLAAELAQMPERGFEVVLLYNPDLPDRRHNLAELARRYPQTLRLVTTEVRPFSVGEQVKLNRVARTLRADLWHAPYYVRPYLLPCPSVLTAYDVIGARLPDALPSRKARMAFQATSRLAFTASRRIIAISESASQDIQKLFGVPARKISVVPLAVESKFQPIPDEAEREQKRVELGLPTSYFMYMGINKPHKNLTRLVQAFKLFRQRNRASQTVLLLCGKEDARYSPALHRQVQDLGMEDSIKFWGEVPETDLPILYACADGFVTASLYEGFGLPVLEAMASGTAVACSNTSSLPEVAGDAALTFDPTDIDAIATALQKLSDPATRADLEQKGLAQAAKFSWRRMAEATVEIYRECMR